ncbi:MAG: hypothetical protein LAO19_02435 [Acidobacteriia bacterium]|nr:hypothetical protein [Terriglobia bacterium]
MSEPTPDDVCKLVEAAHCLRIVVGPYLVGQCPFCEVKGGGHNPSCRIADLARKLFPFRDQIGEPINFQENLPDVRCLVLTAREIVDVLDGFDPQWCPPCLPLVENLKAKLVAFDAIQ